MAVRVLLLLAALAFAGWLLRWGWSFLRAGGALLYLSRGMSPLLARLFCRIEVRTEWYPHGEHEPMPYKLYRPLGRSVAPAVVLYHGASPYGEEHPALDNLARALAHLGLMVFVPRLPRLKAAIIDRTNLRSISIFYRYVQGHERVSPGHISVAGTSFAGGLLLKALVEQGMHLPPPRAVLAYGTYCDLETTLRFILTGKVVDAGVTVSVEPDRWGQVIFFHNYLEHVPGAFDREAVRAVLSHYVLDQTAEGNAARAELPARERRIADLILTPGNPESSALAEEVLRPVHSLLEELSPAQFYSRIHFPVWVLHGRHDAMVPYTEALALKRLLGRKARLYVSGLYAHKELGSGSNRWRSAWDAAGLAVYFGRFLHAVEV